MIETPEQLLEALQADPDVMAQVGQYTFIGGDTAPALAILGSNEYVEGLDTVDGLELIVHRNPKASSRAIYSGCVPTEKAWTVHLVQYAQGNAAMDTADRMVQLFPGTTYASLGAGSVPEVAGVDQLVVNIPANVPG